MIPAVLTQTLRTGLIPLEAEPGLWSILPPDERPAPYDSIARAYDAIVGNSLYNRLVWGGWARAYTEAARAALAAVPAGPVLDCGCGSLVFTHKAYRDADRARLVLFDRSLGMLKQAGKRLPGGLFLQGNALALPFADRSFAGVMAWGLLHIFGSQSPLLGAIARVAAPQARICVSSLTLCGRSVGDHMLHMLHERGEAARPEPSSIVKEAFAAHFTIESAEQRGNMLFITGRSGKPPAASKSPLQYVGAIDRGAWR